MVPRVRGLPLDELLDGAAQLGDVDIAGIGDRDTVIGGAALRRKPADGFAVQSAQRAARPDLLVSGDRERRNSAGAGPLREKRAVGVKDLDALIVAIGDVHLALSIDHDIVRKRELTATGSALSP